jgi:hypothetical protein
MDQLLGHDPGRVFNEEAAAVATGTKFPEQSARRRSKTAGPKIGFWRISTFLSEEMALSDVHSAI